MARIGIALHTMVVASIAIVTTAADAGQRDATHESTALNRVRSRDHAIVTEGAVARRPDGTRAARVDRSHRGSLVIVKNSDGSITYACLRESTPTVEEK
jgi:hypothetical protein